MFWDIKRRLFLSLGYFFFVLGVAGVFLPIMPAVPFLLLACWFFARSSPKVHAAFLRNRWVGSAIRNWEEDGTISRKTKITAVFFLALSAAYGLWFLELFELKFVFIYILAIVAVFILTRPLSR